MTYSRSPSIRPPTWSTWLNAREEERVSSAGNEVPVIPLNETIPNQGSRSLIDCKLVGARSQLYRNQILQQNTQDMEGQACPQDELIHEALIRFLRREVCGGRSQFGVPVCQKQTQD